MQVFPYLYCRTKPFFHQHMHVRDRIIAYFIVSGLNCWGSKCRRRHWVHWTVATGHFAPTKIFLDL
jgi:hypothetical protein